MSNQLETISPIDGSVCVQRDFASDSKIQQSLDLAQQAQKEWKATSIAQRAEICHQMVDAFVSNSDSIAAELCQMMGRPIRYAGGEVAGFAERARSMIDVAEDALATIQLREKPGFSRYIEREPLGVVFVIAPWNYPYLTSVNAIIPALMAGNAVILKPSAQTPLCAERISEAFARTDLRSGLFQYLYLTHADTERMIQSPQVDHICFTGSVPGGEMVERASVGRFIGVGLELGGKDPAYVREDADLQHAVETIVDGAFFNSGQSCCGIERVYVHQSVYDRFVQQAVELVLQYKLGPPNDPATTLGPVVRPAAAEFVREQVNEAIQQGAVAHIDAADFPSDRPGSAYLAPQVLTNVNHTMRVMTEESFGPVVGIQRVSGDDEAIELMNDSEFGLTASIFTRDIEHGAKLGDQIETGTFFINRCDYLDPELAWVGVKKSGRGCTLSRLGYEQLTRPKSFHLKSLDS